MTKAPGMFSHDKVHVFILHGSTDFWIIAAGQCLMATWKTDCMGLHMSFARKSYKWILKLLILSLPCCQEYQVVPFDHPDRCVPILSRKRNDTYFPSKYDYMQILSLIT